ncbi:hypothetical protein ABPG74_008764 [Tetrahymena malaccensis]
MIIRKPDTQTDTLIPKCARNILNTYNVDDSVAKSHPYIYINQLNLKIQKKQMLKNIYSSFREKLTFLCLTDAKLTYSINAKIKERYHKSNPHRHNQKLFFIIERDKQILIDLLPQIKYTSN